MWSELAAQIDRRVCGRSVRVSAQLGRRMFLGLATATAATPIRSATVGAQFPPARAPRLRNTALTVVPAIRWAWPASQAMVAPDQYQICDTIPDLSADTGTYVPTSQSFSENYGAFLAVLDPTSPPPGLLAGAMANYQSDLFKSFVEYTTTPFGHRRAWYMESPSDWMASLPATPPAHPAITLACPVGASADAPAVLAVCSAGVWSSVFTGVPVRSVQMTAQAWGCIAISPGGWFDSGVLAVKREGPFLPGYAAHAAAAGKIAMFGVGGLLCGRVSELIVALRPLVSLTFAGAISPIERAQVEGAQSVRIGPSQFDVRRSEVKFAPQADGYISITGHSEDSTPWIVAMRTERYF